MNFSLLFLRFPKPLYAKTRRIRRFIEGVILDKVTSEGRLLEEFDELLIDLFGGLRFHEMEVL